MRLKEDGAGGLPFMEYVTCGLDNNECYEKARSFGFPFVAKPANGHGGSFVRLVSNETELGRYLEELSVYQNDPGSFDPPGEPVFKLLFERPASEPGKDLRIYVLGNRMIASVMRKGSSDIRANFSLGGKAFLHEPDEEEKRIALSVVKALPSDLIGIDLIYHNGHPVFNEAEDAVGCRMLYRTTDIDIAEEYMRYIAGEMTAL
jgi:glutathione synthase/RimK-type ligase-like ATP-grasp enzyme